MRVSTKGRFAVNALIDLALREATGPVALATISARQQVSLSYLEQLFSRLRRDGLVVSTRGPGGGYALGRPSAQITVADIVAAVDDPLEIAEDGSAAGGSQSLWMHLRHTMLQHMAMITLKSLADEQKAQGVTVEKVKPPRRAIEPQTVVKTPHTTAPNSVFAFGRSFAR